MSGVMVRTDTRELQRLFAELADLGGDLTDVNALIAEDLVAAIHDVFEAEGPGWEPTQRGGKILQDTGNLVNSISPDSGPTYALAFSDVPYGVYHVTGTDVMPARDWTEIDWDAATAAAADQLLAQIAARGG